MRAEEFVASYFDAWNRSDAEGVADHLTQNGKYCDIPLNQELTRKALVADLTRAFSLERACYELVGEALYGENTIAFQYRVTSLDSEGNRIPGSSWFGAEFMTIENGAAVRIADYWDLSPATGLTDDELPGEPALSKYARSGLSEQQMEDYKNRLLALVREDKIFLNSEITLPALAGLMNCSVNHLSQVINGGFDTSFYDFLNAYRIEEAKRILRGRERDSRAILDIPFEVGFNTNSAFYSAFKKTTGQTPAHYRREQLKLADQD